jgi:hypothetical protein
MGVQISPHDADMTIPPATDSAAAAVRRSSGAAVLPEYQFARQQVLWRLVTRS